MDRQELIQVLADVDRYLASPCELILVGGAAMILHFGANRVTRDVDGLLLHGSAVDLRAAIQSVSDERGIPGTWMSDAAKGFVDILPPDFRQRLTPIEPSFNRLRLYVLGLPEQVALKAVALREQDLEDLELLLPRMGEPDKKVLIEVMHRVATFRPDWAQKIRYFLLERKWIIE